VTPRTTAPVEAAEREADFVQSLQRGLAVIRAFDDERTALTLGEVATATGLARAAARRFLLTLVELGYVRVDARLFELSPRVLELGRAYLSSLRLPAIAQPHLQALVEEVGESATIAVLDEDDIVYVAHVPARRIMSITIDVGTRDPAFATSLGRVLLAAQDEAWLDAYLAATTLPSITDRTVSRPTSLRSELARVRRHGYALVDQELEEGLRAIAVPIRDAEGQVVAAVNLAVHAGRWPVEAIRGELLPRLREAAEAIEQGLAEVPEPLTVDAIQDGRRDPPGTRDADFVQSLQRGLSVIRAFDGAPTSLTLSDVAKATGLPRAAARRFLLTLVELGYMDVEGRRFRLRPRVLDLGRPYLSSLTLPDLALPHMRAFVKDAEESSTVAVLDGFEIVYVAHVSARRILSVSVDLGTHDPAFATALGRVLLAGQGEEWLTDNARSFTLRRYTERTITKRSPFRDELARVAAQGYALVDQELEEGLRALAVPIRDADGRVVAAVNVAVHTSRWPTERILRELLPRLRELSAAVERDLRATA
jgi:IclR family transcriptional regulator, pca regulon regulatory protein